MAMLPVHCKSVDANEKSLFNWFNRFRHIAADSARTACQLFEQFGVTITDLQRQDTRAALFRRWPTTYLV
jgi:hypothetical protein